MSIEENKAVVRRLVVEAEQNGNLGVVDELLRDDFVDHTPLPGFEPTREGVKALFAAIQAGFPGLTIRIDDQVCEGSVVVTRKTFLGTHDGPFLGVPASGRPLNLEVVDFIGVRDGRITDHRVILDQMSLMKQLGVM